MRPGYANFAIAEPPLKLVLIEGQGEPGSLNHLGVEVEATADVEAARLRLTGDGLATADEDNVAVLLRAPGQGVGRRARRRAVGDLHRARRRRDARGPVAHGRARRRRAVLRERAGVRAALLLIP